jgi:hypothetical protein
MEAHTERELRVWLAWLEEEEGRPSRADWYSMQVAASVHRVLAAFSRNAPPVRLEDFKLRFRRQDARAVPPTSREDAAALAKAAWGARLGFGPEVFGQGGLR